MNSKSATAPLVCETCGKVVARPVSPLLALCPACLLRKSRTPEAAADSCAAATTSWAETFPQWQFEASLRESEGECAFLVRLPDGARRERAVLQVVSGAAFERAGGADTLTAWATGSAGRAWKAWQRSSTMATWRTPSTCALSRPSCRFSRRPSRRPVQRSSRRGFRRLWRRQSRSWMRRGPNTCRCGWSRK